VVAEKRLILKLRRNKKQTAVINIKKYKRISGKKKKRLYLDVSYVPTYIFRCSKPLNNNRNLSV